MRKVLEIQYQDECRDDAEIIRSPMQICDGLVEYGLFPDNPLKGLQKIRRRPKSLSPETIAECERVTGEAWPT